jgi:hypothetical protein
MFEHVDTPELDYLLDLVAKNKTIIPLRHPMVTAQSWLARNKCTEQMCRDFRTLYYKFDLLGPRYLPLDVDNRQDYLDKINEDFDLDLQTDWSPAGSERLGYHNLRHQQCNGDSHTLELCKEIKPFLDRFYDS